MLKKIFRIWLLKNNIKIVLHDFFSLLSKHLALLLHIYILNKVGVFVTILLCLLRRLDSWSGLVTTPLNSNWTPGQCCGGCWRHHLSCPTVQFSGGISQLPRQYFGVECCVERDTISCKRGGTQQHNIKNDMPLIVTCPHCSHELH